VSVLKIPNHRSTKDGKDFKEVTLILQRNKDLTLTLRRRSNLFPILDFLIEDLECIFALLNRILCVRNHGEHQSPDSEGIGRSVPPNPQERGNINLTKNDRLLAKIINIPPLFYHFTRSKKNTGKNFYLCLRISIIGKIVPQKCLQIYSSS